MSYTRYTGYMTYNNLQLKKCQEEIGSAVFPRKKIAAGPGKSNMIYYIIKNYTGF